MLPNLIIIGAGKCGTSSLHYYLSQHPDVFMSEQKELNFFNENAAWKNGLAWYESNFPTDAKIRGESSPLYTYFPRQQGVAERMHSIIPDAKLIYLIRNPMDRMVSAYMDALRGYNAEIRPIEEVLADPMDNVYYDVSKYYMQLEQYLQYYPLDKILVLRTEDLKEHRAETMKKVFRFLEIDDQFVTTEFEKLVNVGENKLKMASATKPRKFIRYYLSESMGAKILRGLTPPSIQSKIKESVSKGVKIDPPRISTELKAHILRNLQQDLDTLQKTTGVTFDFEKESEGAPS